MMDFDPNKNSKPPVAPLWATYIPTRSGKKFKAYTQRGHALTACVDVPASVLYKWIDEQWVEVTRFDRRERDVCDVCGQEVQRDSNLSYSVYGHTVWARDKGKIADPPRLLLVCGYRCKRKELDR